MHWTPYDAAGWLAQQRSAGSYVLGVELVEEAIAHRLAGLLSCPMAERTGQPAVGGGRTTV